MEDEEIEEFTSWVSNITGMVVFFTIYSVIFCLGLVGNLLIVYSVLKHKSKQTVTNMFMFNLAVANILIGLFCTPISAMNLVANGWPFGMVMCHLWPCAHYVVFFASTSILALVAVNRYSTIAHPLEEKTKTGNVIIFIVIVWLVSIAVSWPYWFFYKSVEYEVSENNERIVCLLDEPFITLHDSYTLTMSVVLLAIPLIVTAYFYIALSIQMYTPDCATQLADERRTNRLLIAMATAFCICTMPQHIFQIIFYYYYKIIHWKYLIILERMFTLMALSSTCFTPLFYVRLNKITFKQFCLVGPCCKHQSNQSSNVDGINTGDQTYKILENDDRANVVTYSAHCDAINLVSVNRDG